MELTKLKDVRKMRKMKIKELSVITGISRNTITSIENGNINTSFANVQAIAAALNVQIILSI